MYCIRCGTDVSQGDKFCIKCGAKIDSAGTEVDQIKQGKVSWSRKKAILLMLASAVLSSMFWVFVWGANITSTEDEAVNIIAHLVETLGRQANAWEKTEQTIDLILYGFSDECATEPGCVDDTINSITTSLVEVEKEKEEIGNLWSEEVLGRDMESYFSKLGDKNLNKLLDVFNIYFPEEAENLEPQGELLLRR